MKKHKSRSIQSAKAVDHLTRDGTLEVAHRMRDILVARYFRGTGGVASLRYKVLSRQPNCRDCIIRIKPAQASDKTGRRRHYLYWTIRVYPNGEYEIVDCPDGYE